MEPALSEKRRFGAGPFVVGCGLWLACNAACGGRSVAQNDEARRGHAGEPSSGGAVSGRSNGVSSGTGGAGSNRGGDTGAGGARGGGAVIPGGTGGGTGGERAFRGICEQRGRGSVTTSDFAGYEDFYIWSEEAASSGDLQDPTDADLVCRIRFDVNRVGPAPAGCRDEFDDIPCEWTHTVEYSNPQVLLDVDGACARSEIGWDRAFIDATNGSRVSYGYLLTFGHDSILFVYSEAPGEWLETARAYWDELTGSFDYVNRLGACRY